MHGLSQIYMHTSLWLCNLSADQLINTSCVFLCLANGGAFKA